MRKRYLLGVVFGVLALAIATASSLASPQFKQTLKYKYLKANGKTQKKGKKSAGFYALLKASDPGATPAGNLKAATKVTLKLKGARIDFDARDNCTLPPAQAASCPSDTKIGEGKATANLATNANPPTVTQNIENNVTAYLRDGGVYLVITGSQLPVTLVLNASLSTKGKFVVNVKRDVLDQPLFQQLGLKVILTSFELTLDPYKRRVNGKTQTLLKTPRCGNSERFKVTTKFKYDDGSAKSYTKRLKCTQPS